MSKGVNAAIYLMTHNAPLIAVVPVARIMPGVIPQGKSLPFIGVIHVDTVRRRNVFEGTGGYCTARLQVTVQASNYTQRDQVLDLIRTALPKTRGTVNGISVDSITHELDGPYFEDEATKSFIASIDYMITYTE